MFQIHGMNERGKPLLRKQLKRDQVAVFFANLPSFLIGMEACSSAHYWARKVKALGHIVRLMAPLLKGKADRPFTHTQIRRRAV